jgi:hypothetical protein
MGRVDNPITKESHTMKQRKRRTKESRRQMTPESKRKQLQQKHFQPQRAVEEP